MAILGGIATRQRKGASMYTFEAAQISVTAGVGNDFRGKPGKRQVTVLSQEGWDSACQALGRKLPWTVRRANLLVEGMDFGPAMVGRQLQCGEAILEITGETDPCSRMQQAAEGLFDALLPDWRGGVTCRVIRGGAIARGDRVELL